MFGHHDDHKDDNQHPAEPQHDQSADNNQVVHPGDGDDHQAPAEEPAAVAAESAADSEGEDWQHPGEPIPDDTAANDHANDNAPVQDVIYPAGLPKPPTFRPGGDDPAPLADESESSGPHTTPGDGSTDGLLDIKVKALGELAPIIDDLDMSAEEKFRVIMMTIQASDNQDLVPKAYEVAHAIEDEKTRAQALLDIVNEINYFTQPHQGEATEA